MSEPHIGAIEKNLAPPSRKGALRRAFAAMAIGDSRVINGYSRKNVYNAATRERVSVKLTPTREGGFRVWRMA